MNSFYSTKYDQLNEDIICPYCGRRAELVFGKELYPHRKDLANRKFYYCKNCDARVGTDIHSGKPLGTMADAELRALRFKAHKSFDRLWKEGGYSRSMAYAWLAKKLSIRKSQCHIGRFDKPTCRVVIILGDHAMEEWKNKNNINTKEKK